MRTIKLDNSGSASTLLAIDVRRTVWFCERVPQNPVRLTGAELDKLESNLQKFLDDSDCSKFLNALLGALPDNIKFTSKSGGSFTDVFNRIKNNGGFWIGSIDDVAETNPNTMTTVFDYQRLGSKMFGQPWEQFGGTVILIHEILHVFTSNPKLGTFDHTHMAAAAAAAATSLGVDVESTIKVTQSKGLEFPTMAKYGAGKEYNVALSEYYNKVLAYFCRKVKL